MKVCPCGNIVLATVTFCPECGRDISQINPNVRDFDKRQKKQQATQETHLTVKDHVIAWGVMLILLVVVTFITISLSR